MQKTILTMLTAITPSGMLVMGCKKDSVTTAITTNPTITGFFPASGVVGTTVVITGTNFSIAAASNTVSFNGVATTVVTASASQLTVTVPTIVAKDLLLLVTIPPYNTDL